MRLSELATYLTDVANESSRNAKMEIVWRALEETDSTDEADAVLALTTCDRFDNNGVSKKTVRKALTNVFACDSGTLSQYESETGSLPAAAEKASESQSTLVEKTDVSLTELWDDLETVALLSGDDQRAEIEEMLRTYTEPKWITHAVLAKKGVSMGFGTKTAAKMVRTHHDSISKEDMAKARALHSDVHELYHAAPDVQTSPEVGKAFLPMLASSKDLPEISELPLPRDPETHELRDSETVSKEMEAHREAPRWFIQPKFDGARVLVHYDEGDIRAFSRNTNEVTDSLPELSEVADALPDDVSVILDGEAVAYDEDGDPGTSQQAMTRFNRKYDVDDQDFEMRFHFFDCVAYSEEAGLEDKPNTRRLDILAYLFQTVDWMEEDESGRFGVEGMGRDPMVAQTKRVYSADEMMAHYQKYVNEGYEGAIVKRTDAPYEFDKRSHDWRKVKDSRENIDLQILEVIEGEDARAGTMGALQLGTAEEYPICKVGTGFSEEDLDWFWDRRDELVGQVIEIEWQELQEADGEYSIRFPVYVQLRDKPKADSLERIKNL